MVTTAVAFTVAEKIILEARPSPESSSVQTCVSTVIVMTVSTHKAKLEVQTSYEMFGLTGNVT